MTRLARLLTVTGRVQGVGFRAFVEREAMVHRLDGWVRNRRDGSVEILAIGATEAIDALAARCREGPRLAVVASVEMRDASDDGTRGFAQRPSV